MATNIVREHGNQLNRKVTSPANVSSGDPVLCGQRPGVALIDGDANNYATVKFNGSASLSVKAIAGGGNSAVAEGDEVFYVDGDTPPLSKKNTGVHFGYAAEAIASGSTATIEVDLGY